ncbi:MAG: PIG-L family deacetylase, partial [Candidatus Omnitrophica bacterium]|nr:PIG-L family deacetylase [Candidatus Omnitrophota bacterium]
RLTFRKGEFLHMGAVRAKETMSAMKFLGEGEQDVSYMGYPDFGTMDILTKYWDTARPYRSMFPRVQKVSYPNAISAGSAYTGESILRDIKTVLSAFKPTHVFVSHPADTNRDHQSLYLFLQVALWDMEGRISAPKVHPYLVHVIGWPRPRGKHPEMALHPPGELDSAAWKQLVLSGDELAKKQECISFYKSQIMCNPPYLYTFARKNELYGDFSPVVLRQSCRGAVDWQVVGDGDEAGANGAFLSYAVVDKDLLIKVALNRKIDKRLGLYINLLGYNRKKDFAGMPKLEIKVGLLGMRIKDKKEVVFIRGAKLRFENTTAYVSVPLSSLGDPDFIMAKVRRRLFRVPLDVSSWRILEVS